MNADAKERLHYPWRLYWCNEKLFWSVSTPMTILLRILTILEDWPSVPYANEFSLYLFPVLVLFLPSSVYRDTNSTLKRNLASNFHYLNQSEHNYLKFFCQQNSLLINLLQSPVYNQNSLQRYFKQHVDQVECRWYSNWEDLLNCSHHYW